jgi:hypothetical protein
LIRNPDFVRALGRNGRETFQKGFLLDRFGTEFRELVEKTVATRGGVAQFAGAT